jgi:hypothetical protein
MRQELYIYVSPRELPELSDNEAARRWIGYELIRYLGKYIRAAGYDYEPCIFVVTSYLGDNPEVEDDGVVWSGRRPDICGDLPRNLKQQIIKIYEDLLSLLQTLWVTRAATEQENEEQE